MAVRHARVLGPRRAQPIPLGPSTTLAGAQRTVLRECFDHVRANIPGARDGKDPEYLHQLRVGARRLRAALRVFRSTLQRDDRRTLRRSLRKLTAVTGPARDWDVNMRSLPAALRTEAQRRRRIAHARLRRALDAYRLGELPRARAGVRTSLAAYARDALDTLDRKALRAATGIDWARAGERHALRIRLRRLRYAAEFLRGAFPGTDRKTLVASLKQLQGLLGELNDREVTRRLLLELGARPARQAPTPRERQLHARLPAAWRHFARAPRFWKLGSDPNVGLIGV